MTGSAKVYKRSTYPISLKDRHHCPLSGHFTGKGLDLTVARHAAAYLSAFGRYTLSAVTVAEVIWGLEKRQSVRRLHAFRASLPSEVLPFADAADLAGRIGAELDRIGQPSDFQRVQQLGYPLILANWRMP